RARLSRLEEEVTDPEKQTMAWVEITKPIYHYSPIQSSARPYERFDLKGHDETWRDMMRCQEEDVYPQAFAAIKGPVIMLHGDYDPHPGRMTRDTLRQTIPHLEYREFEKCGHTPWMERDAREDFLAVLSEWITRHALGR
ncbi:MAG: alpha/beta hydrolase, partial [Candidatus Thiodiazotropha sp.]